MRLENATPQRITSEKALGAIALFATMLAVLRHDKQVISGRRPWTIKRLMIYLAGEAPFGRCSAVRPRLAHLQSLYGSDRIRPSPAPHLIA